MQDNTGRSTFFKSASGLQTGPFKKIVVVEDATFSALTMQFQTNSATSIVLTGDPDGGAVFPALYELHEVQSFALVSGVIQVIRAV